MSFPLTRKYRATCSPVASAGADLLTIVDATEEAETVIAVQYIPGAAATGANTNSRTLNLYNRGTDGLGTTLVATLALVSGVNLVDNVAKTITLSATPANLAIPAGAVLEFESLHIGTGIADPGGKLIVTTQRTSSL